MAEKFSTTQIVDAEGLVEAGHLDLDLLFENADWEQGDAVASFTRCCYGEEGDSHGTLEVVIESATQYGITAYRWREQDDGGSYDAGEITLNHDMAVSAAEEYARKNDEEPDADALIDAIVETGYFGDADAEDIRAVCEEATQYSQGYLLLPRGAFVGQPIGRMWTTNGYLQCEHVTLDAAHPSVAYAAHELLLAVSAE